MSASCRNDWSPVSSLKRNADELVELESGEDFLRSLEVQDLTSPTVEASLDGLELVGRSLHKDQDCLSLLGGQLREHEADLEAAFRG